MAKMYLGIDVGASYTKAIILNGLKKQAHKCFTIKTSKSKKSFLRATEKFVQALASGKEVAGIGMGLPGIVDPHRGVLRHAPNLPFLNGWNAKSFLRKFSKKIAVDNDVRGMLTAEVLWGAAKGRRSAVVIAVGTGVGGGILLDGKIYRGADFGAGEFGHMGIHNKRELSTLERLVGGRFALGKKGREEILAVGIANIVNFLNPEIVILGGGAITEGHLDADKIKKIAVKFILPPMRKTPIVKTKLGTNAQAIGAALMIEE